MKNIYNIAKTLSHNDGWNLLTTNFNALSIDNKYEFFDKYSNMDINSWLNIKQNIDFQEGDNNYSYINIIRNIKNSWAIHQLKTTVNFACNNKLVNWFTGGLNHQVEHHIFPNISHIHYNKIAKIVKKTAKEFNLPYNEIKTTKDAIIAHFKYLRLMGIKPAL